MKDFDGLLETTEFLLLGYNQINVHIGVYKVAITRTSNCALDAHQAVFLGALENRFGYGLLGVSRLINIGAYPADVLAATKAPLFKAIPTLIQALR